MKIIFTSSIIDKKAYGPSVDDQPNFVNRDKEQQGDVLFLHYNEGTSSESDIKKKWKKKRCKVRETQNVIEEEMPKESL